VWNEKMTPHYLKNKLFLSRKFIASFSIIRNRVKNAVAAQPKTISLEKALLQISKRFKFK
jgi:hypothetical protein